MFSNHLSGSSPLRSLTSVAEEDIYIISGGYICTTEAQNMKKLSLLSKSVAAPTQVIQVNIKSLGGGPYVENRGLKL